MVQGLVNAETRYFHSLRSNSSDIDALLRENQTYYEKLIEVHRQTTDVDDREELFYELEGLREQALALLNIQLNFNGGTA